MDGKTSQIAPKVDGNSDQTPSTGYGMIPREVLEDRSLSVAARVIYGWLALERFGGNTLSRGNRLIAERLGLHRETVARAVVELEKAGHLGIKGIGKQRRVYILLHALFTERTSRPDCAKCGKRRKVNQACYCRPCAAAISRQIRAIEARVKSKKTA